MADLSNEERAQRASAALDAYDDVTGESDEPIDARISDLCTDLLHLAALSGVDTDLIIRRMERDFEAETVGEG